MITKKIEIPADLIELSMKVEATRNIGVCHSIDEIGEQIEKGTRLTFELGDKVASYIASIMNRGGSI